MIGVKQLTRSGRFGPNPLVRTAIYSSLIIGGVGMIVPFLWMVSTSLKTRDQIFRYPPIIFPEEPQISNYAEAWQYADFSRFFMNSVIISVSRTVGVVFIAALAGYALAKLRFRGRNLLFFIIISTMMVPYVINIVPVYILLSKLRWPGPWLDSYWGVVVPQLGSAFGIFLIRQFMLDLPTELIEAARVEGASEFRIFLKIVLPLSWPVLSALTIFIFMETWNDFTWPLIVLNSEQMKTIPLGIATFRSPWSNLRAYEMAITALACLPTFLVFVLFRRRFVEGIAMTGLKG